MSYQVLARKWRPKSSAMWPGRGHITRTLQNAIAANRLAPRSILRPARRRKDHHGRILTKALNCAQGPTPLPAAPAIPAWRPLQGRSVDVSRDRRSLRTAASNTSTGCGRRSSYAPVGGQYKVYVIDRSPTCSPTKLLTRCSRPSKRPPPHVIFIFATTEPQKVPAATHSRCQRYGFKRISLNEIIAKLREIAGKEGMTISDQRPRRAIQRAAEGSMRDAQSLLDQAVSYSGMTIKDHEDLPDHPRSGVSEHSYPVPAGLLSRDTSGLLNQVDALLEQGQDVRQFLAGVVEHARNLVVTKIAADPGRDPLSTRTPTLKR